MSTNCPWYRRWWHRRQRQIDRNVMLPAIRINAERLADGMPADVIRHYAIMGWDEFRRERAHWQCACAKSTGEYLGS